MPELPSEPPLRDLGGRPLHRLPDPARLLDVDDERLALRMSRRRHPLLVHHDRRLVHLAAQPDEDVGGDVRVLRVAGEHALQRHVVLAEQLRAASRLVGDRQHAVDVRIVALHVAELVFHELADRRRAVDARDDRDVVARADASVLARVAIEVAHPVRRIHLHRPHVHADLVPVGGQLADAEVVAVDVIADGDVTRREADDLSVAAHRPAGRDRLARDFVAGPDVLPDDDTRAVVLEDGAGRQLGLRDGDVVLGPQHDGAFGQGKGGHGNPPGLTIPDRVA